jgi:ferritin-like metal-binding protein YciE
MTKLRRLFDQALRETKTQTKRMNECFEVLSSSARAPSPAREAFPLMSITAAILTRHFVNADSQQQRRASLVLT